MLESRVLESRVTVVDSRENAGNTAIDTVHERIKQSIQLDAEKFYTEPYDFDGDNTETPLIHPRVLYDSVGTDVVLSRALRFIARTVGGLGYSVKKSQHVQEEQGDKAELSNVINTIFSELEPFSTTFENFVFDRQWSGMGSLLIDRNMHKLSVVKKYVFGKAYDYCNYEISRIKHISRFKISVVKSKNEIDSEYPVWKISGKNKFFAKSFGDPRYLNKKTGKFGKTHHGRDEAPEIVIMKQYSPLDEIYGLPSWTSAILDVSTLYNIRQYNNEHFTNNGIQNMIIIAPETKTQDGRTGGKLMIS